MDCHPSQEKSAAALCEDQDHRLAGTGRQLWRLSIVQAPAQMGEAGASFPRPCPVGL